jgi:hypothetical protein
VPSSSRSLVWKTFDCIVLHKNGVGRCASCMHTARLFTPQKLRSCSWLELFASCPCGTTLIASINPVPGPSQAQSSMLSRFDLRTGQRPTPQLRLLAVLPGVQPPSYALPSSDYWTVSIWLCLIFCLHNSLSAYTTCEHITRIIHQYNTAA